MARHGIFVGNQKIIARYIGDRLVWELKTGTSGRLVWEGQAQGLMFLKSQNQLSLRFNREPPLADKIYNFLEVNGAIFEINRRSFYGTFIGLELKKSSGENMQIALKGKPDRSYDDSATWDNVNIKLYETLDAQPVVPEPQPVPEPEKPSAGTVAFEGTIRRIMAFKNNNFLDFYFYHDNQISNTAYKSVEINGVLFPIKNIRSYGTSVIGVNGEGNFASKKDDLTKAGFPLNDNYRQVYNPKIKLYK